MGHARWSRFFCPVHVLHDRTIGPSLELKILLSFRSTICRKCQSAFANLAILLLPNLAKGYDKWIDGNISGHHLISC